MINATANTANNPPLPPPPRSTLQSRAAAEAERFILELERRNTTLPENNRYLYFSRCFTKIRCREQVEEDDLPLPELLAFYKKKSGQKEKERGSLPLKR